MNSFPAGQRICAAFLAWSEGVPRTVVENQLVQEYVSRVAPVRRSGQDLTTESYENLVAVILNNVLVMGKYRPVRVPSWNRPGNVRIQGALTIVGRDGEDMIDEYYSGGCEMRNVLHNLDVMAMGLPVAEQVVTRYGIGTSTSFVVNQAGAGVIVQENDVWGWVRIRALNYIFVPTGAAVVAGDINIPDAAGVMRAFQAVGSGDLRDLGITLTPGGAAAPVDPSGFYEVAGLLEIVSAAPWIGGFIIEGYIYEGGTEQLSPTCVPEMKGLLEVFRAATERSREFIGHFFRVLDPRYVDENFTSLLNLPEYLRSIAVKTMMAYLQYPED